MRPTPRTIASGVAAAVVGSGVTAALLLGPTTSGAATEPTEPPSTEPSTGEEGVTETDGDAGGWLDETLQQLVDDGLLTEEQADAIAETLRNELPPIVAIPAPGLPGGPGRFDREFGPHDGGIRVGPVRHHLDTIAEAIGIDPETLLQQLRDGATIAEIAEANGVDPQVVIDALVAEHTERVTEWVESGQTGEESDEAPSTDTPATTEPTTT